MSDGDKLRLTDIVDQVDFIAQVVHGKDFAAFEADRTLYQAVSFSLQVIGEASNNLSNAAKAQAPNVPWPKIIALRHRIVHGYFSLELTEIWRIATSDAPALKQQLAAVGLIQTN